MSIGSSSLPPVAEAILVGSHGNVNTPKLYHDNIWDFPKIRGYPILGSLIIRILLFRVLY